jgi:ketosteroid isomerase-like protein
MPGYPRPVKGFTRSDPSKPGEAIMAVPLNHARRLRDTQQAMSEESTTPDLVELNRRAIESAASGDFDVAISCYGPDSVWDTSPLGMGRYRGAVTIRKELEAWYALYDEAESEIGENRDLGNGVVLAVVRQRGRPVGSSSYAEFRFASVTEWTDGLIARVTPYTNIDEARAAAERLAEERG